MGMYADKILEMAANLGKPTITKTKSVITAPNEDAGLDLSSIITMLIMSQLFKTPKTTDPRIRPTALLSTPPPTSLPGFTTAAPTDYMSSYENPLYSLAMRSFLGGR